MSLAKLRGLWRRNKKRRKAMRGSRQGKLEQLEARRLLTGALEFALPASGGEATIRRSGANIELVQGGTVSQTQAVPAGLEMVRVFGTDGADDRLVIDANWANEFPIVFDGKDSNGQLGSDLVGLR